MEHVGHIQAAAPGQAGQWTPAVCSIEPGAIAFTVNAVEVARFDRTTASIEQVEQVFRVRGGEETLWFSPGERERFRLDLAGSGSVADRIALATDRSQSAAGFSLEGFTNVTDFTSLEAAVSAYMVRGYRVEYRDQTSAVMVTTGKKVNHIVHLLITIFTAGLWFIVWLFLALKAGSGSRVRLVQAPDGRIHWQALSR